MKRSPSGASSVAARLSMPAYSVLLMAAVLSVEADVVRAAAPYNRIGGSCGDSYIYLSVVGPPSIEVTWGVDSSGGPNGRELLRYGLPAYEPVP
jgi:hypothetical protein